MKILFAHTNFPAQFGGLMQWLAKAGWDVTFATQRPGVRSDVATILNFKNHRDPADSTHHYLYGTEKAVLTGQGFVRAAISLRNKGYQPDVVVAHTAWGAGSYAKDLWPAAKFIPYLEWYYTVPAVDRTPHDKPVDELEAGLKARTRNLPFWLDFSASDALMCPTQFQADRFPEKIRNRISVVPDGVDTDLHRPAPRDNAFLAELGIPETARVVSFIARGMEPIRGFPEFMHLVQRLHADRPDLHVIVVGEDRVAYGAKPKGASWKERLLSELTLDTQRLHFTGLVPRQKMIKVLQATDAHIYLTAPFVLSWSFREAMSCGAPIVASDVEPIREFMAHRKEGLLVDGYDIDALVAAVSFLLEDPGLAADLGAGARRRALSEFDAERVAYPRAQQFLQGVIASGSG